MCLSEQLSTFFFKNKQKQMVKKSIINETNNFKDPFEKKSVYQFISELYNIPLYTLLKIIIDKSDPIITTDNIPQYSSYFDGTKEIINILRMAGDIGPSFKEVGVYLLGKGKSNAAYSKYGENHAKLAREYGLVYFFHSSSYKVYLTKLGKMVEQLDNTMQDDILIKLSLRIPIIQYCFNNSIFIPKHIEKVLNNYLSKSTAKRRKNNVFTIINMVNEKI